MVFKLAVASITLAACVSAAHIKRVTCPDGNVTSNAAVRNLVLNFHLHELIDYLSSVLCIFPATGRPSDEPIRRTVR